MPSNPRRRQRQHTPRYDLLSQAVSQTRARNIFVCALCEIGWRAMKELQDSVTVVESDPWDRCSRRRRASRRSPPGLTYKEVIRRWARDLNLEEDWLIRWAWKKKRFGGTEGDPQIVLDYGQTLPPDLRDLMLEDRWSISPRPWEETEQMFMARCKSLWSAASYDLKKHGYSPSPQFRQLALHAVWVVEKRVNRLTHVQIAKKYDGDQRRANPEKTPLNPSSISRAIKQFTLLIGLRPPGAKGRHTPRVR